MTTITTLVGWKPGDESTAIKTAAADIAYLHMGFGYVF